MVLAELFEYVHCCGAEAESLLHTQWFRVQTPAR